MPSIVSQTTNLLERLIVAVLSPNNTPQLASYRTPLETSIFLFASILEKKPRTISVQYFFGVLFLFSGWRSRADLRI